MPRKTQKKVRRKKKTKTKKKPKVMKGGGELSRFKRDLNKFYYKFILGYNYIYVETRQTRHNNHSPGTPKFHMKLLDLVNNIDNIISKIKNSNSYEEFVTTLFQFCNEVRSIRDDNNTNLSIIKKIQKESYEVSFDSTQFVLKQIGKKIANITLSDNVERRKEAYDGLLKELRYIVKRTLKDHHTEYNTATGYYTDDFDHKKININEELNSGIQLGPVIRDKIFDKLIKNEEYREKYIKKYFCKTGNESCQAKDAINNYFTAKK